MIYPELGGIMQGRAIGSEFLDPSSWPGPLGSFQGSDNPFFEMNYKWVWVALSTVQVFLQDAQEAHDFRKD